MASVVRGAVSALGGGRSRVTLVGIDKNDKTVEVELDLVETFDVTYNNQISKHTIEKDPNKPVSKIIDHVNSESPTIASNAILSDNLTTNTSAKDKLKMLTYWHKTGSVLTIEGYTVGAGSFGKVLNFLNRGIGNFDSELEEPFYAGTVTEKIQNIVLGNVIQRNKIDIGNDIEVTLNFERIQIAEAMKSTRNSVKTQAGVTPTKKGNTAPQAVKTDKPVVKSFVKK